MTQTAAPTRLIEQAWEYIDGERELTLEDGAE